MTSVATTGTGTERGGSTALRRRLREAEIITGCLSVVTAALEAGVEAGEFRVSDPQLLSNMLYASALGTL